MSKVETFDSREALYDAAAHAIADRLRQDVTEQGAALFAGSGGSTPGPIYERLSADVTVPWEKVTVTLTDERRCAEEDGARNTDLIRRTLLKGVGRHATFAPLDGPDTLSHLPSRWSSVLLGMGTDGHFASIFPAGDGMAEALTTPARVIGTTPDPLPPEAPFSRFTLSLSSLKQSAHLLLTITGQEKKGVLDRAKGDGHVHSMLPIRALLDDETLPLRIFWAP